MKVEEFVGIIGADYYVGVPDSQLKALCDYLLDEYGIDQRHHVIAANEGNAAAMAAGYHLATGKTAAVYMQNSGEGNAVNPLASLLSRDVYAIPAIFVIGWRGEPGVHDEPQHVQQGKVTLDLLDVMEVPYFVLGPDDAPDKLQDAMNGFSKRLEGGACVAVVVRKGALAYDGRAGEAGREDAAGMLREDILKRIVACAGGDPIVSTTGKTSRELFEIREACSQGHERDFLTVGSMGHASSIALGLASQMDGQRIWCVEGDGAVLMHMGAMALVGASGLENLIHVVVNNAAHESVGGMPTVMGGVDLVGIARSCGYAGAVSVSTPEELDEALAYAVKQAGPFLLEVKSRVGSRPDLGRPTTTPQQNKAAFMEHAKKLRARNEAEYPQE